MHTSEPGLRERKRAETRDRLETAAVTLVLRDGLERATLDAICESADVSTRTFFNYFDSKEDAILGLKDSTITPDAVDELLRENDGADAIELTIRLMFRVVNPSIASSKLFQSRMKIVKQHPQLLGRIANQMQRMTEQLTSAVRPILQTVPGFGGDDSTEAEAESEVVAEVMLALCSAAARAAIREWATSGNQAPIAAVEERAIGLVRNTIERIK